MRFFFPLMLAFHMSDPVGRSQNIMLPLPCRSPMVLSLTDVCSLGELCGPILLRVAWWSDLTSFAPRCSLTCLIVVRTREVRARLSLSLHTIYGIHDSGGFPLIKCRKTHATRVTPADSEGLQTVVLLSLWLGSVLPVSCWPDSYVPDPR